MSIFGIFIDPVESECFNIKCARANNITISDAGAATEFCRQNDVDLLIVRCDVGQLDLVHRLQDDGFRLMDTLVYYSRPLDHIQQLKQNEIVIRPVLSGEEYQVEKLAKYTFENYIDHYHSDPLLDNKHADEAFGSWARRSCTEKSVSDQVMVAADPHEIIGFATLRMNSPEEGEGVLFGVSPQAQGRGIYGRLIGAGLSWCKDQGAKRMVVSTQINNYVVQAVWIRNGFTHYKSFYTFHKWFS